MSKPTKKKLSQLDGQQTLKSAHNDGTQSFQVSDIGAFDVIVDSYDVNNNPTKVSYYVDDIHTTYKLTLPADVAGSLAGTHFLMSDSKNSNNYYVWYRVSGGGADPAIADRTGIVVDIDTNDSSAIVTIATKLFVEATIQNMTITKTNTDELLILSDIAGITDVASDVDSGVVVSDDTVGTRKWEYSLIVSYDVDCNLLTRTVVRVPREC